MPLNALTITTNSGIVGLPFAAAIGGKSAGTVLSVKPGSAPGFGIVNGVLSTLSLPYEAGAVTLNEYNPTTGESRDTTLTLAGVTVGFVLRSLPAGAAQYRLYPTTTPDGTLSWGYSYASSDGSTYTESGGPTNILISAIDGAQLYSAINGELLRSAV